MIKIGFDNNPVEEYIIDIRERGQVIKARYAIDEKDVYKYDLMGDHYIQISFFLDKYVWFDRGNYVTWNGSKFILREDYVPNWKSKYEIEYTLQFDSKEILAKDVTNYYLNQQMEELEWNLFADAKTHLAIFCQNMNRYFGTKEWVVGTVEPIDMQNISYNNTTAWDGLNSIADAFESEFYFTGTTVHLVKKVSFGSEIDFEDEVNVVFKSRTEGEGERPYNRIVALGSTRNIPANYRETTKGENVDAVYQKRLRIPVDKGYVIDAYPDLLPEEVIETGVVFDDIYPKRIGTISEISTVEYPDTNSDTGEVTKWNAYRFKDSGLKFKKEYLLSGTELRIVFQKSKRLNGLDFAVKYNPKDKLESDPEAQLFEIIRNDTYGKDLPNENLYPEVGDEYILYGFNIQLVSDQFIPAAEKELYGAAVEWLKENRRDKSVWEYESIIVHFAENTMDLELGQKIKIINESFKEEYRSSRIQGFEKRLINKYQATYTVGDNAAKSWAKEIDNSIKQLQVAGVSVEGTKAGNGVYIIKQFDATSPTDFNVYSAKAADAKYLNKQTGGTIQGDTLFQKNMQIQGTAISNVFQNSTFTSGALGSGFQLKNDSNGSSYGEIDYLTVRKEMYVNEFIIKKISSIGGSLLLSLASMKTIKVEDKGTYWRCYFDNDSGNITNDFQLNDQAICQVFTGRNIKRYWCLVVGVGSDYIDLSKTDKDGSGVPSIGDEIIQLGNRTNVNRQSARLITTSPANSDSMLEGINSYNLTGKERTAIKAESLGGSHFTGSFTISTNGTTAPIYKDTGLFVNGTVYYLNDRVSYLGSYWVCIANSTITTPSETSLVWRKDTSGQTDIKKATDNIYTNSRNFTRNFRSWGNDCTTTSFTDDDHITMRLSGSQNGAKGCNIINRVGDCIYAVNIKTTKATTVYIGLRATKLVNTSHPTLFDKYDGMIAYFNLPAEFNERIILYANHDSIINANWYIGIKYGSGGNEIDLSYPQLIKANKYNDWLPAPEDIQTGIDNAQKEAQKVRTEYKTDFVVLDTKIASKVSQSDFNLLGNRVSTTESNIVQLSNSITSTVEKIDNFFFGGRNYLRNYKGLPSSINTSYIDDDTKGKVILTSQNPTFWYNKYTTTIQTGTEVTFSISCRTIAATAEITQYLNAQNGYIKVGTATTDWQILKLTRTLKGDLKVTDVLHLSGIPSKGLLIEYVQLEIGDKTSSGQPAPEDLEKQIQDTDTKALQALQDSNNAKNAASKAQSDADKANSLLIDIASDNKLTPNEKQEVKREWDSIISEYTKNLAQASTFGVSSIAYTNAYSSLNTYITPLLSNLKVTSDIVSATFNTRFKSYYDARTDLLNVISIKAKEIADNAQSTANSKNRTYYQDPIPTVPSGGHKTGDLWYKTSLVDSSGNINADTSKNIYQLQYRWDGSIWKQINWSVSRSKIEQTDSSIKSVVDKTGINSLGNGETLYSKINQTSEQITLEVNKIQIGGNNLLKNSNQLKIGSTGGASVSLAMETDGSLRIGVTATGPFINNFLVNPALNDSTLSEGDIITISYWLKGSVGTPFNLFLKAGMGYYTMPGTVSAEYKQFSISVPYKKASGLAIHLLPTKIGMFWLKCLQIEKGNKASDWKPATEDIPDIVGSSLTMKDNKISLASTTIELKGNTIAKAIQAEKLNVNNKAIINTDGSASFGGGTTVFNVDGSGKTANGNIGWDAKGDTTMQGDFIGKISSNSNGHRIVIDPSEKSFSLVDSKNNDLGKWTFYDIGGYYSSSINLIAKNDTKTFSRTSISGADIKLISSENGLLTLDPNNISLKDGTSSYNVSVGEKLVIVKTGLPESPYGLSKGQEYCGADGIVRIVK